MTYPKNPDGSTTVARIVNGQWVDEPEVPGTVPQWLVELFLRADDNQRPVLVVAVETKRHGLSGIKHAVWLNGEPMIWEPGPESPMQVAWDNPDGFGVPQLEALRESINSGWPHVVLGTCTLAAKPVEPTE